MELTLMKARPNRLGATTEKLAACVAIYSCRSLFDFRNLHYVLCVVTNT